MSYTFRFKLLSSTAVIGVTSTFLLAMSAQADCLPENNSPGAKIICDGLVGNSYISSEPNLEIKVSAGSVMTGSPAFTLSGNSNTLINEGLVQSSTSGIDSSYDLTVENSNLISGTDYGIHTNYGNLTIVNKSAAVIRGHIGISSANYYYQYYGTYDITNSGRLEGTGGLAIENPYNLILNNQETGQIIGGIRFFDELNLNNAGLIDGGNNFALKKDYYFAYHSTLENSGTITSAVNNDYSITLSYTDISNSGIIEATGTNGSALFIGSGTVTNSGKIQALGSGTALFLNSSSLINEKTGEISASGLSIGGSGAVISNSGSIVGNVDFTSPYSSGEAYLDMGGTITGNLSFGGGDDLFLYDYDTGTGINSVSGTVDPGDGYDSYGVTAQGKVTITPSLSLGFEQFAVEARGIDSIVTLSSLENGVSFGNTILTMGKGKVINNTSLNVTTEGTAAIQLRQSFSESTPSVTLVNNAAIITNGNYSNTISGGLNNKIENHASLLTHGAMSSGIQTLNSLSVVNKGDITTSGDSSDGVNIYYALNNPQRTTIFDNSGSIKTSGPNANGLFLRGSGVFTNSGDIQTSGLRATGVYLEGWYNVLLELENTGIIIATGVEASGITLRSNTLITNSGTITSGQYSAISNYASYSDNIEIINRTTGQITGGNGIAIQGYNSRNFKLDNAGKITGDITFLNPYGSSYSCDYQSVTNSGTITGSVLFGRCNDTFIHDGGTVSGVVDLGADNDTFILNLDSGAALSDIAGGVIAGEGIDSFVYSSGLTKSIDLASVAGFEIIGVLADGENAHITLNSTADFLTDYLNVNGMGTVTSHVDFKRDLLDSGYYAPTSIINLNSGVTFNNKANVELGAVNVASTSKSAVYVGSGSKFINEGTVTALDDNAIGITTFGQMTNSGTVTTGTGPAIALYGLLENFGTLSSQGQVINITSYSYDSSTTILNKSSGVIEGHNGQAIGVNYYFSNPTAISNAGQIIGDITLGQSNNTYYANGGYLDGNLNLGSGDDILFVKAGSESTNFLSGIVNAGNGSDAYGLAYHETGDAALVQHAGFERYAIGVIGKNSIVTLKETGQAVNAVISVAGNGTLLNEMDINSGYAFDLRSSGSTFVNKAIIGGIKGTGRDINITNEGSITSDNSNFGIYLTNAAGAHITNTGTMENFGYGNALVYLTGYQGYNSSPEIILDGAEHTPPNNQITSFRNEGTMTGGNVAMEFFNNIKFENSGVIKSRYLAVSLTGGAIDANNKGTIKTTGNRSMAVYLDQNNSNSNQDIVSFVNEGEILTTGNWSYAVYVNNSVSLKLINHGKIKAIGGALFSGGTNYQGNAYQNYVSSGAVFYRNGILINKQGGTIEVTKQGTVAIDMASNYQESTILENAGSIIGTDGVNYTDYNGNSHFIAGAIRGNSGVQIIRNSGLIKGSVDLGDGNDRFEMSEGGMMDGQVDGGLGDDHILLNYSTKISLDGSKYLNFETLEKIGSGNFNLSGILNIAEVTITEGTLSGTGTITGNVMNWGTIAPGNSPGTLTIEGNLTMAQGSILSIEAGDLVNVMGDASLTGSILQLAGDVSAGSGEFLAVTGVVGGQFSSIVLPDNNSALFKHVSLSYGAQNATWVVEDQFAALDATLKNSAEGKYVSSLMTSALSAETFGAFRTLSSLNSHKLAGALSQMTGESHAAAGQMGLISGQSMIDSNRGRFIRHQGQKAMRLWVEGIGAFDRQDGNSSLSGHKENLYGTLAGIDFGLSEKAAIGFSLGYVDGNQTLNGLNSSNDYKAYLLGLNGVYHFNRMRIGAAVSYGIGDINATRNIQTGVLNGAAHANYDLNSVTAQAELAYDLGLESVILEPQLGLSWTSVARKNAEETGLPGLNLAVNDYTQNTVTSHVAIRLAKNLTSGYGTIITPELTVGWDYDLKQDALLAISHFAGNAGASQNHYASTSGKNRLTIGAGLTANLTNGITIYARYSGRYASQRKLHQANLGIGINF